MSDKVFHVSVTHHYRADALALRRQYPIEYAEFIRVKGLDASHRDWVRDCIAQGGFDILDDVGISDWDMEVWL